MLAPSSQKERRHGPPAFCPRLDKVTARQCLCADCRAAVVLLVKSVRPWLRSQYQGTLRIVGWLCSRMFNPALPLVAQKVKAQAVLSEVDLV
jgi:hypothetical protein